MPFIDITTPLSPKTPTWRNEQPFTLEKVKTIKQDGANVTRIIIGSHAGTHIDAPKHFIEGGESVENIPLDALIGPCRVLHMPGLDGLISVQDIESYDVKKGERILLRANDGLLDDPTFHPTFHSISEEAAQFLVEKKVQLVGIDYLSVEQSGTPGHPTHRALLEADIVVAEGVYLNGVAPGEYTLYCLPLKILGGDGAPVRAVLKTLS